MSEPSPAALPALRAFAEVASELLDDYRQYIELPVAFPQEIFASAEVYAVLKKLSEGQTAFGLFAFSERKLRPIIDEVRIVGRKPQSEQEWARVRAYYDWHGRYSEVHARWHALAGEMGLPTEYTASLSALSALTAALRSTLFSVPEIHRELLNCLPQILPKNPGALWPNVTQMELLRDCLRDAAAASRLSASRAEVDRTANHFTDRATKFGPIVKSLIEQAIGNKEIAVEKIEAIWGAVLQALRDIADHRPMFAIVAEVTELLEKSGAVKWAERLRKNISDNGIDQEIPDNWAEAWDFGAAMAFLRRHDQRDVMQTISAERLELETNISKSFERLVRERTFYTLAQQMTGPVRAALMMFATSLRRIGTGRSAGAARHRRAARQAMAACYAGVPCWIMPSWRVAEQLPGEVGTFDLVIMDEASQSDVKEVTTLLRGKKVLVVGDDKQVSPTAAFIENAKIDRLERTYLSTHPFKTLLLPGASLYDLAKVMFPNKFVMLREHFRCVEPIIQFSAQFYTEALVPLRVPTLQERIDPPLVDIYVRDGSRTGDKINYREAEFILDEIAKIVDTPHLATKGAADAWRTIGVISLIGSKQAALINRLVLERFGEEIIVRHKIACGDSATFQGNERDIVLLSMVADSLKKQAQTATHFEQRFNVAMSRARDRLYLVRSVREEELNPNDLKARVIAHMREPMKGRPVASSDLEALCDSDFERAILKRLIERGYRVTPQVGAMGYSIDLVVEGANSSRLAIECDGDKYHGPERWADDMARQRVLERVGWKFWRCWSSSFTIDPDGCMADLFDTLERLRIYPVQKEDALTAYTEFREVRSSEEVNRLPPYPIQRPNTGTGIRLGDRVVIRYLDDNRTASFELTQTRDDLANGYLAASAPLGKQLIGANEEDEIEFDVGGRTRRALVVRVEHRKPEAA